MDTDYKALCLELFGTTNVDELKRIAQKNNRGAGRKKVFTDEQILEMRDMQAHNISQEQIAKHFCTTRQTISRYLKDEFEGNYNYQIDFMYKTHVCTTIFINFLDKQIKIINKTDDIIHRAFGTNENPNWDDFNTFLLDRCFPKSRGDRKSLLQAIGIDSYDPFQIIEHTKGKTYEDSQWMRFKRRSLYEAS